MTPLGRAAADVRVGAVPKLAVTVYGRPIGSVIAALIDVVSPDQPQDASPLLGEAVSTTARPWGMKSPLRLALVSAEMVPPLPAVAMSLKARFNIAVTVPPARLPVMLWDRGCPSDHDAHRHRVRLSIENCVS